MFKSISLSGLKDSKAFGYAAEVPYFKGRRKVTFKPGLNILFGPNGCGKSTILQILGRTMCATQGGISTLTESAIQDGVDMFAGIGKGKSMTSRVGLKVEHDGQPVVFCDPRAAVGLIGGAFDDDFFSAGVREVTERRSHGQRALSRSNGALAVLLGHVPFPTEVAARVNRKHVNDMWQRALDVLEAQMAPTIDKGQGSVLLDEPEANFSLVWQARLWARLAQAEVAKNFQLIVASHSPFALGIAHANYIDLVAGFRQECEDALRKQFGPTDKETPAS